MNRTQSIGSSRLPSCAIFQFLHYITANITTYQAWPKACGNVDVKVDGIFFDEAPANGTCLAYMQSAAAFARSTLSSPTLLFNAGAAVNSSYWGLADYINVFENSAGAFTPSLIPSLDGDGDYAAQASAIIYGYAGSDTALVSDVASIVGSQASGGAALGALLISDISFYSAFPANWAKFVDAVAQANSA
ncbi:hypothetical protein HK405_014062 [Cladochytrium tenue]|nr:hypothetical protein HK405_014062 [Cladochytrium tenue]